MRIGILGTGTVASHLGQAWTAAGHQIVVGGRDGRKARELADRLGPTARPGTLRDAATEGEAVLLAVLWSGAEDAVRSAGGADEVFAGKALIDPTNAVEHGVGRRQVSSGTSAAERIAECAPGAHVVKAFHMFPADTWTSRADAVPTVPLCGDDDGALATVSGLVTDVNAQPVVLGGLDRARQLEEAAGFVIGLAFSGANPAAAVPSVAVPQTVS